MASDIEGVRVRQTPFEKYGLSKQKVETIDMLSEGPINGICSGYYTYSGVEGEIGWRTAQFNLYPFPLNDQSLSFLRSIYWNEIPVINDAGNLNFQDVDVEFTIGKKNGETIQTLSPYEQTSRNIGEKLFSGPEYAKIYRILNNSCRGVIINVRVAGLSQTDSSNGEVYRDNLNYSISYKPIFIDDYSVDFIFGTEEQLYGKVTRNPYIRNSLIMFEDSFLKNKNFIGWEIKIQKTSPDYANDIYRNSIAYIDSITEVQGNVYSFPNSAVVRSLFDSEYFQRTPERAFEAELLKVKIPGNYNPILRTYSGEGFATTNGGWNGTFATGKQYTNNPAWCYYDLLTNKRYGLGKYINPDYVDKWELYNISKYCDTLVSDGYGGLEPRFTCNLWLTAREEAYRVINDMASIFRGLTYYSNGNIQAIQDSTKEANVLFTNSNVEDGNFNYSSTSKRARHSIAIVRYNDPKNFYKPSIEYVENLDSIRKYGVNEVELTAIGCSSRGQAIRLGRWALLSDSLETEAIKFTAGLEAAFLRPGDVFKVFDSNKKVKRYGGRTLDFHDINSTGTNVVLDYTTDLDPNIEYKISFLTPSYSYNEQLITGLTSNDFSGSHRNFLQSFTFSGWQATNSGSRTVLNFSGGMNYDDYIVTGYTPWIIELSERYKNYTGSRYFTNTNYDYFRVLNVKEEDTNKFNVEGLQYNPQKFIEIESGLIFGRDIYNNDLNKIPATPHDLSFNIINESDNLKTINYNFLIDSLDNITEYQVYVHSGNFVDNNVPSNSYLLQKLAPTQTNSTFSPLATGLWNFRVYSYNGIDSLYSAGFASGTAPIFSFEKVRDIIISNLNVVDYSGSYTGNATNGYVTFVRDNDANPTFSWQVGFQGIEGFSEDDLRYRVTVREYSEAGSRIPSPNVYYEEWDISGNLWQFTIDKNFASSGGPHRGYQVVVEAHDNQGKTSAGNELQVYPEIGMWHTYPFSYDILNIVNPRSSGIELQDNIPTFETGVFISGAGSYLDISGWNQSLYTGNNNYHSTAYFDPNGGITIEFTSGQFDEDLVGGYIYVSSKQFPKFEAKRNEGLWGAVVAKARFDFDPKNPIIYHPTVASRLKYYLSGYIAVSFYDEIDKKLLENGNNISTGLYISNMAIGLKNIYVGPITYSNPSGEELTFCSTYYYESVGTTTDFSNLLIQSSGQYGDLIFVVHSCPNSDLAGNSYDYELSMAPEHVGAAIGYNGSAYSGSAYLSFWGAEITAATGIVITHIGAASFESFYGTTPPGPEFSRPIQITSDFGSEQGTWPITSNLQFGWYKLNNEITLPSGGKAVVTRYEPTGVPENNYQEASLLSTNSIYSQPVNWSGEHISSIYSTLQSSTTNDISIGSGGTNGYAYGPVGIRYRIDT